MNSRNHQDEPDALLKMLLGDIAKGLATTAKHLFRKSVTIQYPKERMALSPRYRGLHILLKDEEGKELCNACGLCARTCPDSAIEVVGTGKGKERVAESYTIDLTRCMFCGLCVEACPRNALRMTDFYELADYSRDALKADKTVLEVRHVPKEYKK